MGGIIGVENTQDASTLVAVGLMTLQHRGEESSGITISGNEGMKTFRSTGLVSRLVNSDALNKHTGTAAIGHVRYTSAAKSSLVNALPFQMSCIHGQVSVAQDGNLTNFTKLKDMLLKRGAIFSHTSDTEILLHLIAMSKGSFPDVIAKSLKMLDGAFSVVVLREKTLIGARDINGIRPLVLGKIDNSHMLASETSAIEVMGGKYIRDIEPGEIIVIENGRIKKSFFYKKSVKQSTCIFEQVYISRPDSMVFGQSVKEARVKMGAYLAEQMKGVKADIVMPVPDTGYFAAMGFSRASGILFEAGFVRNHYLGRSFIKPSQHLRDLTAKLKLRPIKDVVNGKDIVLIDDSIVRGTTSRRIIKMLKDAGVKKIHLALSCPPVIAPCFYGIDTPVKEHLIAATQSKEKIKKYLEVESLTFLSLDNLAKACCALEKCKNGFCTACFSNKYPTKISKDTYRE
ncbi:MAG: amidophosphoribosyltransferase [Endomicrobia bacterium]|nr:amidophosphoribosyltransferase [Endomicrobiia bacterium]MCL2506435.1 amidophosphoribosyltransferase [Endomicrobiia bacterium]